MKRNKGREWLGGPALVILVIMAPFAVILFVQIITAIYLCL